MDVVQIKELPKCFSAQKEELLHQRKKPNIIGYTSEDLLVQGPRKC